MEVLAMSNKKASKKKPTYKVLDPELLYQEKAMTKAAESQGVERLVYKIFGPERIGSLALALDPFAKFKDPRIKITPVNRERKRLSSANGAPVQLSRRERTKTRSCPASALNPNAPEKVTTTDQTLYANYTSGLAYDEIRDTTKRTRNPDSDYGEMEYFTYRNLSGPRSNSWQSRDSIARGSTGYPNYTYYDVHQSINVTPWGGYLATHQLSALKDTELAACQSYLQANAIKLFNRARPRHKSFSLLRSIAELKDLPLTLRNAWEVYSKISNVGLLDVIGDPRVLGQSYLSSEFGIQPLYRDVVEMISLPAKVSRRVNYLLSREGKSSTYRSKFRFEEQQSTTPTFSTPQSSTETLRRKEHRSHREIELRCAINQVIQFPDLEVPQLREDLLRQLSGAELTPSDVYELVPWTWLIDWFSGLGDYIEALMNVNDDKDLVNYGFLTCECKRYLHCDTLLRVTTHRTRYFNGSQTENTFINHDKSFRATGLAHSYIRRDIGTVMAVKSTSDQLNLNPWQTSILAALFAARGKW
jgi:hypothetical protein